MLRLVNNFGQAGFEGLGVDEGTLSLGNSADGQRGVVKEWAYVGQ